MPLIILSSYAYSQTTLGTMIVESQIDYKYEDMTAIGSAKFHVKHSDGVISPALESYLFIKNNDGTPIICKAVNGHSLKIKIEENEKKPIIPATP